MKVMFTSPFGPKNDDVEETSSPRGQIMSAIQEQIPPDMIAARISEMIKAQQSTGNGELETDWRTVEAGIRLYLDYTTKFPAHAEPEAPQPAAPAIKISPKRVEVQRSYSAHQVAEVDAGSLPPRPSNRVLPTRKTNPVELEPLDNMRKRLIQEIPLAALQEADDRNWDKFDPDVENDPEFDLSPSPSEPGESKRNLPLVALVACLVIGGFFASASQFHTRVETTSATPVPSPEKILEAEAANTPKPKPATGVAAFQPRFEASMW